MTVARATLGTRTLLALALLGTASSMGSVAPLGAQSAGPFTGPIPDPVRAAQLYVSNRPEDHDPYRDHARDVREKARTDSVFVANAEGSYAFAKITYPSRADGLEIPAYLFRPLEAGDPESRSALVWVHGGVHGDLNTVYLPMIREAVERGYVVIAPDYRGSIGYGRDFHNAIDYGGYEVDDVLTAADYLTDQVEEVDPDRIAVIGWSHGGFISAHAVFREEHPFAASVAIVPVSNLIFRLSYKGPAYQALFSTQERIRGLPHERPEIYIERSPVYHVDRLEVPMLVHVATNDEDVDFVESEMFVHALQVEKPDLAETKVYVDPPGGHSFSLLVDQELSVIRTPELRDSWRRTWDFLERSLQRPTRRAETN